MKQKSKGTQLIKSTNADANRSKKRVARIVITRSQEIRLDGIQGEFIV